MKLFLTELFLKNESVDIVVAKEGVVEEMLNDNNTSIVSYIKMFLLNEKEIRELWRT